MTEKQKPISEYEQARCYWSDLLADMRSVAAIPGHMPNTPKDFECKSIPVIIEAEIQNEIIRICKNQDVLILAYITAVFSFLVASLTRQEDVVVCTPMYATDDMPMPETDSFVLLRNRVNSAETFRSLLSMVRESLVKGYLYQQYPLKKMLKVRGIEQDEIMRYFVASRGLHSIDGPEMLSSFGGDLAISTNRNSTGIELLLAYNEKKFSSEMIQAIAYGFAQAAGNVTMSPKLSLSGINLKSIEEIGDSQRQGISEKDIHTDALHILFEKTAQRFPDRPAIWHKGISTNYCALNEKASSIAALLESHKIKHGATVALLFTYSPDMIAAMLGVLKAGCAYLPMDPAYPQSRLAYMMEDSGAVLMLTQKDLVPVAKRIAGQDNVDYVLDDNTGAVFQSTYSAPDDVACLIYTSGSTGIPKAVVVEHVGMANYILWRIEAYKITPDDVTLQLISFSFDGFGANAYTSLLSGGMLVLPDGSRWGDFTYIHSLMRETGVTMMSVVPGMYTALLDVSEGKGLCPLRLVVLAGERSSQELIKRSNLEHPDVVLVNEYGPTECTIACCANIGMLPERTEDIGTPIANTRAYVMSPYITLVPDGLVGELCIAGAGVTQGYWRKPDITSDCFCQNPLVQGQRMYRTGDSARISSDGHIEWLGRLDDQVKISGYRVEPEEVNQALLQVQNVENAVVLALADAAGSTKLNAYYIAKEEMDLDDLKEALAQKLPDYMIPGNIYHLEAFPRTSNGKIDREALAKIGHAKRPASLVLPRTELESSIAVHWRELLHLQDVGIDDNFFDLGGNSLLLMRMHARLEKQYPGRIAINDLFTYPTIRKIVQYISSNKGMAAGLPLKTITLPKGFASLHAGGASLKTIRASIPNNLQSMLEQVQAGDQITIWLLAACAYAFYILGAADKVPLYVMTQEGLSNWDIDMAGMDSALQLLNAVSRKPDMLIPFHALDDYELEKTPGQENSVLCLISASGYCCERNKVDEIFDIQFEYICEQKMLMCKYHRRLSDADSMEKLLITVVKTLGVLMNNDNE